jgi:hypothetical protein
MSATTSSGGANRRRGGTSTTSSRVWCASGAKWPVPQTISETGSYLGASSRSTTVEAQLFCLAAGILVGERWLSVVIIQGVVR